MTIDTNILIAYLKGEPVVVEALVAWQQEGRALIISSVTIAELLAYSELSEVDVEMIYRLRSFLISVPSDDYIAEIAAKMRRVYRLSLGDAAIVATAVARTTPLVTRDKQLRRVKEITVLTF